MVQATGFNEILDYNNPDTPIGVFSRWQLTQLPDGSRESASSAFLTPDIVDENGFGANPGIRELQFLSLYNAGILIFGFAVLRPRSRGSVRIQSDDPLKMVLADDGFLDDPADMELTKNAFRIYVRNIATQLSAIDPSYQLLSPTQQILDDDALLEAYIRQTMQQAYHEQSTLRMAASPAQGVVNSCGEVFGVKKLVVADCSILPTPVDGNTQAPAYLVGLTIAQHILRKEKSCSCNGPSPFKTIKKLINKMKV